MCLTMVFGVLRAEIIAVWIPYQTMLLVCFFICAAHDPVRTSILRPPSKPRVRNPITMKQLQEEKKLKISLLQQQQQHQVASPYTHYYSLTCRDVEISFRMYMYMCNPFNVDLNYVCIRLCLLTNLCAYISLSILNTTLVNLRTLFPY